MKKSVYIETTVVSYLTARPSRDVVIAGHQEATRELWPKLGDKYDAFVSVLVQKEAGGGDADQAEKRLAALAEFEVLETTKDALSLAQHILEGSGIPEGYADDALHIAIATVHGVESIVTWNFAHMNNPFTRQRIRQLVEAKGYICPELCSPDELLESEQ
ncbi:MAG: type II toxin-antitoxin system VapC family toxin [Kiritimatiellae bacterium]|nr:type II toxin-antitoxin system VapC family toxin [Kiritimatiellia bacterium]